MKLRSCLFTALLWTATAQAQILAVEQIEKSFTVRAAPTITALREAADPALAHATVILLPGGTGHLGFRADAVIDRKAEPRTTFGRIAKAVTDPGDTPGRLHFVILDSPWALTPTADMSPRATRDHMVRIESVVEFYRARLKQPVWLMGHSNAGFSLAEFVKYLQDKKKEDLLAGIIFSAGRTSAQFGPQANLPALFIGSEKDNCQGTLPAPNVAIYEKFKAVNKAPTEHLFIQGSQPDGGDPCHSGIHMYNAAEREVAKAIDDFIARHARAK